MLIGEYHIIEAHLGKNGILYKNNNDLYDVLYEGKFSDNDSSLEVKNLDQYRRILITGSVGDIVGTFQEFSDRINTGKGSSINITNFASTDYYENLNIRVDFKNNYIKINYHSSGTWNIHYIDHIIGIKKL